MEHVFTGKWITDSEFAALKPRNVFHKQLEKVDLPCDEHRNRHILFEGWGRDTKWNTSLFHLTMSYAAVFMADIDLKKLFEGI